MLHASFACLSKAHCILPVISLPIFPYPCFPWSTSGPRPGTGTKQPQQPQQRPLTPVHTFPMVMFRSPPRSRYRTFSKCLLLTLIYLSRYIPLVKVRSPARGQCTCKVTAARLPTHAACFSQEMWALSCFMTGAPMADVTTLFREAFFRYNSANPLQPKACVRFATRSMLLLADYCRQHGLHAEAHSALTRAQSQVSCLCSTLGTEHELTLRPVVCAQHSHELNLSSVVRAGH